MNTKKSTSLPHSSRDGFASKFGVLVAAAGSAVGLGNLWRFPYMVAENGGAAFIIIYILFMVVLCLPVMLAEFVIGRRSRRDAVGAFDVLAPRTPWKTIGVMGVIASFVILAFYCVVGGWTLSYIFNSFSPSFLTHTEADYANLFHALVASPLQPVLWALLFILFTALVVAGGVKNGIERYSKILMPMLFVIVVLLAVRSLTLDTEMKGLRYLFTPDFSKVTPDVVLGALGQAFFSLSIGMGCMITYGSYVPKSNNLLTTSWSVMGTDLLFALLSSLAVIPAVFAFGIPPGEGPGLVFVTFPEIFAKLPLGNLLSIVFFVLLAIAALTSSISLFEVITAYLVDARRFSRRKAVWLVGIAIGVIGSIASLSQGILSSFTLLGRNFFSMCEDLSSNIMLPVGGILISLFVGWYMKPADVKDELSNDGALRVGLFNVVLFILRYLAPAAILVILLYGLFK